MLIRLVDIGIGHVVIDGIDQCRRQSTNGLMLACGAESFDKHGNRQGPRLLLELLTDNVVGGEVSKKVLKLSQKTRWMKRLPEFESVRLPILVGRQRFPPDQCGILSPSPEILGDSKDITLDGTRTWLDDYYVPASLKKPGHCRVIHGMNDTQMKNRKLARDPEDHRHVPQGSIRRTDRDESDRDRFTGRRQCTP